MVYIFLTLILYLDLPLPLLLPQVDPRRLLGRLLNRVGLLIALTYLGLETPLLVLHGPTHLFLDPINAHGHGALGGRGNDIDPSAGVAD